MNDLMIATALLLGLLAGTQLLIWGISFYFNRREAQDAREFLENQLLAEAEALRAVTRNREALQVVERG